MLLFDYHHFVAGFEIRVRVKLRSATQARDDYNAVRGHIYDAQPPYQ